MNMMVLKVNKIKIKNQHYYLSLYGTLSQFRRMAIYDEFCRKQNAILFATDIASRGLDFPSVNWVIQLDCPEDVNTYMHRVGRTARFEKGGESLLVVLSGEEESMIKQLSERKIPINKIEVNSSKMMFIRRKAKIIMSLYHYVHVMLTEEKCSGDSAKIKTKCK